MSNAVSLSDRAQEIALELGAEGVVIISIGPDSTGHRYLATHGAYLDPKHGLTWEHASRITAVAATDLLTMPAVEAKKVQ